MKWKNSFCFGACLSAILLASCREEPVVVKVPPVDSVALNYLVQSPGYTVLSQQTMIRFGDSLTNSQVSVLGYIVPDERRTNSISARFNGRIEKLYVRFPYEYVRKGQKLMEIYSPELTTAINEYIFLFESDSASLLTKEGRLKLERLGLTRSQIAEAERTQEAPSTITLYSGYEGYNLPVVNSASEIQIGGANSDMGMQGMTNSGVAPGNNSSEIIREGSYFSRGQTLFSLNDGSVVIALLNLPSPTSAVGSQVQLISEVQPDSVFYGNLDLIEPVLRTSQKFLLGRVELNNENGVLKFNSLVSAKINKDNSKVQTLPASCVYDLGTRKIVWVKREMLDSVGVFEPRIVITGTTDNGQTEIISGLEPGEEVALQAGLLTDREGFIQTEMK